MEVSIIACDLPILEMAVDNPAALEQKLDARIATRWDDFPMAMELSRDKLRTNPALLGWWTHLVLADRPPRVVGVCGFNGPPSRDGMVEIAYAIAPAYQGRGLATAAAAELIRRAFKDERVGIVCAHTLPEPNASTRVLEKLGLKFVGLTNDEDEGTVWRWELARPELGRGANPGCV